MSTFSRACRTTLSRLYNLGSPAATVILLRDAPTGIECLLLLKSQKQRFGGLHVFPGGAVDPADEVYEDGDLDVLSTVTNAAIRELHEETNLDARPGWFTLLSHWMPPGFDASRRGKVFSTFFLTGAASSDSQAARVDGDEIVLHHWLTPERALALYSSGELPMLPPTLHTLTTVRDATYDAQSAEEALRVLATTEARSFHLNTAASAARALPHVWPAFLRWLLVRWRVRLRGPERS